MNIGESVKNLKHIYKKTTYFKTYGVSIFLFIFITFIFFLLFSFYNIRNNIHKYQSNPSEYRCHPTVIPFAGYIYPHPGMSNSQFNKSNLRYCMREILKDILGEVLLPLEYVAQLIQNIQSINFGSLNFLREIFSDIRNAFSGVFNLIWSLLANFFASINNIIVYLSSAFAKFVTIPIVIANVFDTMIYCFRVVANQIMYTLYTVLVVLGIFISALFLAIFFAIFGLVEEIPIVGQVLAPILASAGAIGVASIFLFVYVIIAVNFEVVLKALREVMTVTAPLAPQKPNIAELLKGALSGKSGKKKKKKK